ncbi:MAG: hypothetical protein JJE30_16375 [Desulfuromonadales bacterium]|nr:hypothetical protein [Desulfuromonadales bacterium]
MPTLTFLIGILSLILLLWVERINEGGVLELWSRDGKGTRVSFAIPVADRGV